MADNVFINGRAAVHAGSAGKSVAFPDVCLCPPSPPAGPVPTPLPNTAQAADLQGCAATVTIEGNRVAHAQSFVARSTGNEVAQSTGGGVITHVVQGAAYFQTYSRDVMIEGQPAVRHLDLLTHNHAAKMPGNTPPAPWISTMMAGPGPAPKRAEKSEKEGKDLLHLVVKDEQGQPVSDLALVIETPAQKTLRCRTLAAGEVMIRGLKKGSCQVTLLDWQGKPMKEAKAKLFAPAPDGAPASLPTGKQHDLTCQIATMTIDFVHRQPGKTAYPKFVLESSDGSYKQQRTPRNDLRRDRRKGMVRFDYLPKEARFTLLRHDEAGRTRVVFEDKSFDEIADRAASKEGQ